MAKRNSARTRLIILPGLHGTSPLYRDFIAALPPAIDAIALDYPLDRLPLYHEVLPVILHQIPEGRFAVLGDSYSGPLALMVERDRRDRVEAVILSATFVTNPIRPLLRLVRALAYGPFVAAVPIHPIVAGFLLNGTDRPALLDRITEEIALVRSSTLAGRLRAAIDGDHRHLLANCAAPLLHLRPRNDRVITESAAGLIRSIRPDAAYREQDTAHAQLISHPAASAAVVAEFLLGLLHRQL